MGGEDAPTDAAAPRRGIAALALVFAATGACGLAYEVAWARSLALLLGVDAYAHAVVLACFMGGQAAGYAGGARLAGRAGRRIERYGWIEVAIGALALCFPLLRRLADGAFTTAALGAEAGTVWILLWKLLIAAALVLPPCILMGLTFPLLIEGAARAGAASSRAVPRLYAANAAGAVLGALLAGYALVPSLGVAASFRLLAAFNIAAGLAAVVLSRAVFEVNPGAEGLTGEDGGGDDPVKRFPGQLSPTSPAVAHAAVACAALTGAAALAYEVVWTRLLALTLGASTYAFTIVLAAFVGGISIGAAIAGGRRISGSPRPLVLLGAVQLLIGASVAGTLHAADLLPLAFERLRALTEPTDAGFARFQLGQLLLAAAVLAAPTILGGIALPLAARAVADLRGPARGVSLAFAANTLGSLAGALGAGLVLLPLAGVRGAFAVAIGVSALAGAIALAVAPGPLWRRLAGPVLAAAVALAGVQAGAIERGALTFQVFRAARRADPAFKDDGIAEYRERARRHGERIVFDRDGAAATVTVLRTGKHGLTLLINGKADASTGEDMRTQMLLAHIPLLLRPAAKEVLVVGLGCGVTAGSALAHPIERLDVVELSPEVVAASELFESANGAPLQDPRTHLIVDDARSALRLSARRYDVVISEPSNPWVAGVANLFTREHFQAVADRLAPGGVALQWIHLYEISDELVDLVLRTWLDVFPETRIFVERGQRDLFLVGSREPLEVDLDALVARFESPRVKADLARDGLDRPEALLALELFGPRQARMIPRPRTPLGERLGQDVHRDDLPVLETEAPRAFFRGARARGLVGVAFMASRPPEPPGDRLLERLLQKRPSTLEARESVRRYLGQEPRMPWPELEPEDAPGRSRMRAREAPTGNR